MLAAPDSYIYGANEAVLLLNCMLGRALCGQFGSNLSLCWVAGATICWRLLLLAVCTPRIDKQTIERASTPFFNIQVTIRGRIESFWSLRTPRSVIIVILDEALIFWATQSFYFDDLKFMSILNSEMYSNTRKQN